jgi:hypothetical protein
MFCEMTWYLENRVIYVRYPEIVTAEVAADYVNRTTAYIRSSPAALVHTISDPSRVRQLPPISESKKIVAMLNEPRMGWAATYGSSNPLLKMLVQVVTNVIPVHVRFVNDLDDAIKFLNHIDPTLPDLKPFKNNIS